MTNLMHGTMMTQRKVMVGAKSGLHFKSMSKYYRKYGLQEKVFTTRLHFYIQRHSSSVKHITPEDHDIIHKNSASWKKCYKLYELILSAYQYNCHYYFSTS